jgi:GNAT superfamily N-acetyltransferase
MAKNSTRDMEILQWDIAEAAPLTGIFNTHLDDIPYSGAVTPAQFILFLHPPGVDLQHQKIIVAQEKNGITGFAQVATVIEKGTPHQETGLIRILLYPRGQRSIGQTLLEAAEHYLKQFNVVQLRALDGLNYYFIPAARLPDRWEHVHALLGFNGYSLKEQGIFMHWRNYTVEEPFCPVPDLKTHIEQLPSGVDLPNLWVEVFRGTQRVGGVKMDCLSYWVNGPEAGYTCYTDAFGVSELERGRGLGRYLLQLALWKMRELGYRHATLDVNIDNYGALLLYAGMGYRRLFTEYLAWKALT